MSRIGKLTPPKLAIALALIAVVTLATGALAASFTRTGGQFRAVKVVTGVGAETTTSSTYVDIPGMSATLNITAGERALLMATFSGDAYCIETESIVVTAQCRVQLIYNNQYLMPPGEVVFIAAPNNLEARATQSMQFVIGPLSAGSHTVKAQFAVYNGKMFTLQNRVLSVVRVKVG